MIPRSVSVSFYHAVDAPCSISTMCINIRILLSIIIVYFLEYRSFRFVSTSSSRSSQTEVMKGEGDHGLNLDYEDILKAQKDDSVLIVDVREDDEIKETGKLPGSIHVPSN